VPRKRSIQFKAATSPRHEDLWPKYPECAVHELVKQAGGRLESLGFTADGKEGRAVVDMVDDARLDVLLEKLDATGQEELLSPDEWRERYGNPAS
jgi:hypothetical protein